MAEYDRLIAAAKRMIAKKGQTITYRRCHTVDDSWHGDDVQYEEFQLKMAFIPVDRVDHETMLFREYSDIPLGFEIGYLGDVPFKPSTKDQLLRNGEVLNIRTVTTYRPSEQTVLHSLGLYL